MKLKTRIKSFWRHNKKYVSMYVAISQTIVGLLALPISVLDAIQSFCSAAVWLLLWMTERKADFYHRMMWVVHHKAWKESCKVTYEIITRDYKLTPKNNETED